MAYPGSGTRVRHRSNIRVRSLGAGCLACVLSFGCRSDVPVYDFVLRGGTVIDGSGAVGRFVDVGVVGERIETVARNIVVRSGTRVIDVPGLIVAPGFWDNHAHLVELEERPVPENFLRQGITTIVASLHSQDQVATIGSYMERVEMAPNVGLFAGHTWIRKRVMGLENRAPTSEELDWMVALVDSAMQQGALGLATGLEYVPSVYAELDEVVALARAASSYGGLYATHMRDEGVDVLSSVRETLEVGRLASIPVQVNHHKVTGAAHVGWTERTLALLDSAAEAGTAVAHDVYPYTAYSTYSDLMFPPWALADGAEAFAARVADPQVRARLVDEMRVRFSQQTGAGPESIQFREVASRPDLQGRTLADYLSEQGRPTTIAEAVEALIELQLEGGFIGIFHGMDEDDVRRILEHPTSMIETDGDLVEYGVGHPHPRSYGSFPRVLAKYVREEGLLTLEEAIRKMTSMPAAWFGQGDRGLVAEGMIADLVVFDADRIQDRAQYTDPHHYSEGVVHLFVAGTPVIENGDVTGATPGTFLERGSTPSDSP